jgi:hypothetical protein
MTPWRGLRHELKDARDAILKAGLRPAREASAPM